MHISFSPENSFSIALFLRPAPIGEAHRLSDRCQLAQVAAIHVHCPDLARPTPVGDEGDLRAVRRPGRLQIARTIAWQKGVSLAALQVNHADIPVLEQLWVPSIFIRSAGFIASVGQKAIVW